MAQNKAMTTGEYNGEEHAIKFDPSKSDKARVYASDVGSFHASFDDVEVDQMDHAACVWFRLGGEIVTFFHVPNHVGRRIATEAARHGRLHGIADRRS